jgi:hypothetical protein
LGGEPIAPMSAKGVHTLGFPGVARFVGMTRTALATRRPGRECRRNTLAFYAHNQGVGFAIVARRGYGRRRWLDYSGRGKKNDGDETEESWPFPS